MLLPNQLTVTRIILTPIFLILFLQESPLLKQISVVIYLIAAFTDWYDGWLARKINYITNWGKFLDPLADKILTLTAFFAFSAIGILPLWMVLLMAFRDALITGIRLYADYRDYPFKTSRTAKWKTFFQMAFLVYLLAVYTLSTMESITLNYPDLINFLLNHFYIFWIMFFVTAITLLTGVTYFYQNRKLIKKLFTFENKQN